MKIGKFIEIIRQNTANKVSKKIFIYKKIYWGINIVLV